MQDETCVFCKIRDGSIPCLKLYEDESVLAFLDIAPVAKGHTLVIPKDHHPDIFAIPESVFGRQMSAVHRIASHLKAATNAEGMTISMANHSAAGQSVFHAHVHLIPRYHKDGLPAWPQKKYTPGEAERMQRNIVERMRTIPK